MCHKQRYHLQQKLTAKFNRAFYFANSLSLLPNLIFEHIQNSRTSKWEDMLLFFFTFDVILQWELEAFSFAPFIMRLLTASCAPTSIPACAPSAEPVCLCFFLYVCACMHVPVCVCSLPPMPSSPVRGYCPWTWSKPSQAVPWVESLTSASGGVYLPWQGFVWF